VVAIGMIKGRKFFLCERMA